ncbi:MAG: nucleotidyltransferase domain-containing protein [Nitrospirae bacterium]|nr:nucleotidyltransferase domain-containing protein [Nitrospirota bacterium]
MDAAVTNLLEQVEGDPAILAVVLYGSQARREATARSDVDVCLILAPGHDSRDDQLRARLTYLPVANLDIRVFQQLPLYIRRRVLREGAILSCRDLDALYDLACRTAKAYENFRPRYRSYLEQVARAGS